jgi:predicted permease
MAHVIQAARALARAKGFTAATVTTLAIAIAGATVMFALIHGVLLKPLPVVDQDRLIVAGTRSPTDAAGRGPLGATVVRALRDNARLLDGVAAFAYNGAMEFAAVEAGIASSIRVAAVSGEFFRVLGTPATFGRTIQTADDAAGAEHVVVIGERLWRRRYGGAHEVVGRRLALNGESFIIAGVVPDVDIPRAAEAWISLASFVDTIKTDAFRAAGTRDHDLLARLAPGVSIEQARAEISAIHADVERTSNPNLPRGYIPVVQSFETTVVGDLRPSLLVLSGAVALVLLIACANVANLFLLRGEAQRTERAVRKALGASRWRLGAQTMGEAALLGVAAAVIGVTAAWWSLGAFVALSPADLPRADHVGVDLLAVVFATALGVLTVTLAGLVGVLVTARGERSLTLGGAGSRIAGASANTGRRSLVVTQVALSIVIVAAAGALTRTLVHLQSVDMGMSTSGLVFADLFFPPDKYPVDKRRAFFDALLAQMRGTAAVDSISPIGVEPYAGLAAWSVPRFSAEGQGPGEAASNPPLNLEAIHPEHFATLNVRIVRGRGISPSDTDETPLVTVISEDVARRIWPGDDPIGKRIRMGGVDSNARWFTVVGVAQPTRYRDLAEAPATMYVAAEQFIDAAARLAIRTSTSLDVLATLLRERVRVVDADVHVLRVQPFDALLARPLARPRFMALLTSLFGGVAVLLAAVGLYGVLAAFVRHSTREIGVRIALGATALDIRRLVFGEAAWLSGIGIVLGIAGSFMTRELLRGLLFGVQPFDPTTLIIAAAVLTATAAAASYLPVRRATRVDPVILLRAET